MIENAGTPSVLLLNDWFIEDGNVYGLTEDRRYIICALDKYADQRPVRGGRVQGKGHTFVLSRPLGTID